MVNIRVFVLSIPNSYRRRIISEWLNRLNIPFEWIDGILLNTRSDVMYYIEKFKLNCTYDFMKTPKGNLGANIAWLNALDIISRQNIDYALFLEDDCVPMNEYLLKRFMRNPKHWIDSAETKDFIFLHPYFKHGFGTHAQLITPNCAKQIVSKSQLIFDQVVQHERIIDTLIIENIVGIQWSGARTPLFHQTEPLNDETVGERMTRRTFLTE